MNCGIIFILRFCLTRPSAFVNTASVEYNARMPKMKSHELTGMPDNSAIATKDILVDAYDVPEDPPVWLLRYTGFARITTDPEEAKAAAAEGAKVTAYLPLEDVTMAAHPTMAPIERLRSCEDVLRSLASFLEAGGYNAPYVDPKVFHDKIMWGIQEIQQGEMV